MTNKHNIQSCPKEVCLRIKNVGGHLKFFDSSPDEWVMWPRHDLAMLPIDGEDAQFVALEAERYIADLAVVEKYGIGPGDRVFMIGRFMGHDGGKSNIPSVRFGNISTNPGALKHPQNLQDISWGVEMRSISGYSGSPVFGYWGYFDHNPGGKKRGMTTTVFLLGVDWGHVHHVQKVLKPGDRGHEDGLYIKANSAMCGVVPAWDLQWCLDSRELRERRQEVEREFSVATEIDQTPAGDEV